MLAETPSGARAVVPGDLEESELYYRVISEEAIEKMPPPDSGKTLTAGRGREAEGLDRAGGGVRPTLGVHGGRAAGIAGSQRRELEPHARWIGSCWLAWSRRDFRLRPRRTR